VREAQKRSVFNLLRRMTMPEAKAEKRMVGAGEWNRFCRESYLAGLETVLKGQEETEKLVKDTVDQGCRHIHKVS
jgi:hypothetical protein